MITPSTSIALGFAFVLLGGINVWLVLEAWSRVKTANVSSRMLALHRKARDGHNVSSSLSTLHCLRASGVDHRKHHVVIGPRSEATPLDGAITGSITCAIVPEPAAKSVQIRHRNERDGTCEAQNNLEHLQLPTLCPIGLS